MRIILAIVMGLGMAGAANAADCARPVLLSSMAMEPVRDGAMMVVTASIDNNPRKFLLSTGDIFSQISRTAAGSLKLTGLETAKGQFDLAGRFSNEATRVTDLTMGNMQATGFYARIVPDPDFTAQPGFDGVIATNMMSRYDVDLDFANLRLNYFSPELCRGAGVYWAPKAMTVVPMQDMPGRIFVPVMLDGHTIWASLDTGSEHSLMNPALASKLFGLGEASPDMTPVDVVSDGVMVNAWRHTFASLSFGGLTLNDPPLAIVRDMRTQSDREIHISRAVPDRFDLHSLMPDLILGMDVLRQTHLYVSFRNHRVYVSPAGDGTMLDQAAHVPAKLTVWQFGYDRHIPFVHY